MKEINPHIQEAQQVLSNLNKERYSPGLQKIEEKEETKLEKDDRSCHRTDC